MIFLGPSIMGASSGSGSGSSGPVTGAAPSQAGCHAPDPAMARSGPHENGATVEEFRVAFRRRTASALHGMPLDGTNCPLSAQPRPASEQTGIFDDKPRVIDGDVCREAVVEALE